MEQTEKLPVIPASVKKRTVKLILSWILGAGLSIGLFLGVVCGFQFDIHLPLFYQDDVLLTMLGIKSMAQGEWFPYFEIQSSFTGAPYGTHMADFPSVDILHMLIIKTFSLFSQNPFVLFNLYYIFGYLMTTCCTIYVAHRFRLPQSVGILLGILYSFLPFHLMRYKHLFLASYYLLPLVGMIVLWVWNKKPLLFRLDSESKVRLDLNSSNTRLAIIVCFLNGMAGIYYAFFPAFSLLVRGSAHGLVETPVIMLILRLH